MIIIITIHRLSPKSRLQGLRDELHSNNSQDNGDLATTNTHLSVPRAPGTDGSQVKKFF